MFNYALPKNKQALQSIIDIAISAASTMRQKVQVAAVAVLYHAEKHGDYTYANKLMEGLGHGVKRDSLQAWFTKFGGLEVDEDTSKGFTSWKGSEFIRDNFQQAKNSAWYDEKKDPVFQGYSLEDELQKVIKKYNAQVKKAAKLDESDKDMIQLNAKESTIQQLLALAGFESIIEDDSQEQEAA